MNIIRREDIEKIISMVKEAAQKYITNQNINDIIEKGKHDYTTKVDIKIENFIREKLKIMYPHYRFLGEEKGFYDMDPTFPTWILDPIDGTTNLIHGFDYSAISLGLVYENDAVFGVVYNPFTDELFYAEDGLGAYLNGEKISVSDTEDLSSALISVGTAPWNKSEDAVNKRFEIFKKLYMECPDIRRTGSAALDICYVAAGKTDAFFEDSLKPWDYAAATCILNEAGGKITTTYCDRLTYSRNTDILATNNKLHEIMYNIINE